MTTEETAINPDNRDYEPPAPGLAGGGVAALFLSAIFAGSVLGLTAPETENTLSAWVDHTLLLMIFLLFLELRPGAIVQGFGNLRFLGLAWVANFLIVPFIGFAIASMFLAGQPLFLTGLIIYFLSPCTDWFLGFTRMARGDTALGAALIPINLVTQLLLFPVWLWLFTRHTGLVDFTAIPSAMAQWFLIPLLTAQVLRLGLERLLSAADFERLLRWMGHVVPLVIAALILQIFAANISAIAGQMQVFAVMLIAIFLFFVATFVVGETLSRLAGLRYPQHALLTMTMAARNAPLMLAVTAVAIPDQPLILAALVIGMLLEFPHLTALKQLLLRQRARRGRAVV